MLWDILVSTVVTASLYALVGLGMNVLFRPTNAFSFAHGNLIMLGAMTCAIGLRAGMEWYVAALVSILLVTALSVAAGMVAIAPVLARPGAHGWVISTLALSIIIDNVSGKIFGPDPLLLPPPPPLTTAGHTFGPLNVSAYQVALCVFTLGLLIAAELIYRTRTGRAVLALAEDRQAALLRGINPSRLVNSAFLFSGAIAAIAGIAAAPQIYASIDLGSALLLKGFEVVAVGGIGSNVGTLCAALLLGLVQAVTAATLTPGYQDLATFVVLILAVMIRPSGLFGKQTSRAV